MELIIDAHNTDGIEVSTFKYLRFNSSFQEAITENLDDIYALYRKLLQKQKGGKEFITLRTALLFMNVISFIIAVNRDINLQDAEFIGDGYAQLSVAAFTDVCKLSLKNLVLNGIEDWERQVFLLL